MKKNLITVLTVTACLTLLVGCNNAQISKFQNSLKYNPNTNNSSNSNSGTNSNNKTDLNKGEINVDTKYQTSKPVAGDKIAIMKTSMGDIKIKLFPNDAPKAVENFTTHAKNGYYNNLIFHRVMNDFMIQGGDPQGNGMGGESIWGKPFEDEFTPKLSNFRGALSMANSGPNTNGSQFFIVQAKTVPSDMLGQMKDVGFPKSIIDTYKKVGGTPWLDGKHTVFGQVYDGMNVVDKISTTKVDAEDKPLKDIKIISITIEDVK